MNKKDLDQMQTAISKKRKHIANKGKKRYLYVTEDRIFDRLTMQAKKEALSIRKTIDLAVEYYIASND